MRVGTGSNIFKYFGLKLFTFRNLTKQDRIKGCYCSGYSPLCLYIFLKAQQQYVHCTYEDDLTQHHCSDFPYIFKHWRVSNSCLLLVRQMRFPLRHCVTASRDVVALLLLDIHSVYLNGQSIVQMTKFRPTNASMSNN
jgi:hypothetical protein